MQDDALEKLLNDLKGYGSTISPTHMQDLLIALRKHAIGSASVAQCLIVSQMVELPDEWPVLLYYYGVVHAVEIVKAISLPGQEKELIDHLARVIYRVYMQR